MFDTAWIDGVLCIWFSDFLAMQFTCTLTADEKGEWYKLMTEKGYIRHDYYDRNELLETCQSVWKQIAHKPRRRDV